MNVNEKRQRKVITNLHSIAGLFSGVFILIMSLSGAMLVFHEELDGLQVPHVKRNGAIPEMVTVDSVYNMLRTKYPHGEISSCVLPADADKPYSFSVYDSSFAGGKAVMQVFIDPYDGELLARRGGSTDMRHNFMSWLAVLHSSFHLGKTGEWLLGFFAAVFLLSIITGLILYRKQVAATLLFRKRVFRKENIHQLVGTYALLFNLMIGVTGFWMQRYVFKKEFYTADNYVAVIKTSPDLFYSFTEAYAKAQRQYPEFTASVIYFAQNKKGKMAIYGSRNSNSFIHSKQYADVLYLDSVGSVAKTAFVDSIDASSRYDIINAQVHYGRYGGLPVKIVYSLFGLTGGFLSVSGFILWYRRRKRILEYLN